MRCKLHCFYGGFHNSEADGRHKEHKKLSNTELLQAVTDWLEDPFR